MIELPRRSVTRFFIPLIDVLTLLFCIYLLMPIVQPASDDEPNPAAALSASERQELARLRRTQLAATERERLLQEKQTLQTDLTGLRQERLETLQRRLAIRVLEIGDEGKLYYHDAGRFRDRRVAVTSRNVAELIRSQQQQAGDKELYFLILYPRVAAGHPLYPLRAQREEFERWFEGVAHGYDIPVRVSR